MSYGIKSILSGAEGTTASPISGSAFIVSTQNTSVTSYSGEITVSMTKTDGTTMNLVLPAVQSYDGIGTDKSTKLHFIPVAFTKINGVTESTGVQVNNFLASLTNQRG